MRLVLLLLALVIVSPRSAEAQLAVTVPTLDRAGGGVGVASERASAERLSRIPVRVPDLLPIEGFPLFDLAPPAEVEAEDLAASADPASAVEPESAATAAPREASGAVRSRVETVFYDVRGASRSAIAEDLHRHGPNLSGRRFFGMTEWSVRASYRPAPTSDGCAVDEVMVHVDIKTHLPRWAPGEAANPALHRAWDQFIAALDTHEHGHRTLAEEAAAAIRARLAAAQVAECGQIDGVAQQAMGAVMQVYESQHLAYDAETGHGRTQGAVWPPR